MGKKSKKGYVLFISVIITLFFSFTFTVLAEDDHEKSEHKKNSEYYERSDDDAEGEGNENEYYEQTTTTTNEIQAEYWNIWSRKTLNNPNNNLPITSPGELSAVVNGQETKLYFIPQEGQLLVSGDALAKVLGAEAKYYSQSKIMKISKGSHELIVRADSNAAYENRVKNPMPVKATAYEKTIYLPVSVAANSLGYRITFNSENNTLLFEQI
jgi:hypothetical protein